MNADGYRFLLVAVLAPLGIEPDGDDDWRDYARCRDLDPELFFPVGTTGPAEEWIRQAKAVCGPCKVREVCLQWALDTAQEAGVWGGLSEEERRVLRRNQLHDRLRGVAS